MTILIAAADMVQNTNYLKLDFLDTDISIVHVDIIGVASPAKLWDLDEYDIREV